jgi:hypothetical protein
LQDALTSLQRNSSSNNNSEAFKKVCQDLKGATCNMDWAEWLKDTVCSPFTGIESGTSRYTLAWTHTDGELSLFLVFLLSLNALQEGNIDVACSKIGLCPDNCIGGLCEEFEETELPNINACRDGCEIEKGLHDFSFCMQRTVDCMLPYYPL